MFFSQTSNILVAASQRHQVEGLRQASSGCYWATLAAFQRCNVAAELRVDHGNLNMLYNHAADVANGFPGVVGNDDVGGNLLSMIVDFLVEGHFQTDLAVAESEALADKGAR